MGAKESKTFPITSEEAAKRGRRLNWTCYALDGNHLFFLFQVSEAERRRLNDAFRRLQLSNGSLSKSGFLRDVLGDGIPSGLAEKIFTVCGGGGNHVKGLHFREVLTVLVLITRGSREEKIKCEHQRTLFKGPGIFTPSFSF